MNKPLIVTSQQRWKCKPDSVFVVLAGDHLRVEIVNYVYLAQVVFESGLTVHVEELVGSRWEYLGNAIVDEWEKQKAWADNNGFVWKGGE